MRRALAGRVVFALALGLLAFVGAWLLTALAPGDPLDDGLRSSTSIAAERARLGLDQPIATRLFHRLRRAAVLDFGTSIRFGQPVLALVIDRTVRTAQAGAAALLLALAVGIPLGVAVSRSRRPALRQAATLLSTTVLSVPALVLALVLAMLGTRVGLPSVVVMIAALALPAAALVERLQARAMDDVWREPCLTAARARGLSDSRVTWRHAWPLSLPAVLGSVGVLGGHLLSGALAIELVTARSGLGLLTYEALLSRDLDLAAGCAGAAAALVGVATLAADIVLLWVDPRSADA